MIISDLPTPCLLIDQDKMLTNIERLSKRIGDLGCHIRPHVKTHKSVEITKQIEAKGNVRGITVSTLKEAKHFFAHGYKDILYAVGIIPSKFNEVHELIQQNCDIKVILDSVEVARELVSYAQKNACCFKVLIELDVDGHRAGVEPTCDDLLDIATTLAHSKNTNLLGVMTHAGASYECFSFAEQRDLAEQERDLSLLAASRIREANIDCPIVSIGSTPTAFAIDDLTGISEVRAGVYVLFDLVMAGLDVCALDDIAISVLGSIIGCQKQKHLLLSDAGWMAMSRDRGSEKHEQNYGYGIICNEQGKIQHDLVLQSANQEHGIIAVKAKPNNHSKAMETLGQFTIGDLIRILPNHACATASQYQNYFLVSGDKVVAEISSINGW